MDHDEILRSFRKMLDDTKAEASKSLEKSFDVYSKDKASCGEDTEKCKKCLEEYGGLCPMRESLRDAFYAGAASYQLGIEVAHQSGVPGAVTEKLEKMDEELSAFGRMKIDGKIAGMVRSIIISLGGDDD